VDKSQEKKRSSNLWALLALLLIAGAAAAIFYYSKKENHPLTVSDLNFNITKLPEESNASRSSNQNSASSSNANQSGLNLIQSGIPGMFGKRASKPSAAESIAQSFTALCHANEGAVQALAMAYTRQYPAIRQYGRDWMSHPDLKKLNDDYMRDHDPVKFLRGLSASQNFGALLKKYAKHPEIEQFAQDAMKRASPQFLSAGMSYLSSDGIVKGVAAQIAAAVGLPTSMFNSLNDKSPEIDQKSIMNSVNAQIQQAIPQIQSGGQ